MNRSHDKGNEGLFKNEFIDVIKANPKSTFRNNYDKNKKVLDEERYELKTLEEEIMQKHNTEPQNFHGLEPYEMAEFRIGTYDCAN